LALLLACSVAGTCVGSGELGDGLYDNVGGNVSVVVGADVDPGLVVWVADLVVVIVGALVVDVGLVVWVAFVVGFVVVTGPVVVDVVVVVAGPEVVLSSSVGGLAGGPIVVAGARVVGVPMATRNCTELALLRCEATETGPPGGSIRKPNNPPAERAPKNLSVISKVAVFDVESKVILPRFP